MEKNELPCGAILAIFGVGVFLTIFLVNYPDESSDAWTAWAAWVQAFGSIGAIMAAYFLGERQAKINERLQRSLADEQVKQKRVAFYAIAESTGDLANEIDKIFVPNGTWAESTCYQYHDSMVDDHVARLHAVPIHEIGSAVAVREFIALAENLREIKNCARHWNSVRYGEIKTDVSLDQALEKSNELMKKTIEKLHKRVQNIRDAMYPRQQASNQNATKP